MGGFTCIPATSWDVSGMFFCNHCPPIINEVHPINRGTDHEGEENIGLNPHAALPICAVLVVGKTG